MNVIYRIFQPTVLRDHSRYHIIVLFYIPIDQLFDLNAIEKWFDGFLKEQGLTLFDDIAVFGL